MTFDSVGLDFDKWKQHRRRTTFCMLIINLVGGIDLSIILTTVVPYLSKSIKASNPNMLYALVTTGFCLSSALFGVISGRVVDQTRRIKHFTRITLSLQIIGNVIYSIPFSPVYPLIGRFIAGAGESFTAVCIGEIIRSYDYSGSNKVICYLATLSSFGYVIGPVLSIPFTKLHFHIWVVSYDGYNIPGLFVAVLATLVLVLSEFLIYDCSLKLDMKVFMLENELSTEKEVEMYLKNIEYSEDVFSSDDEDITLLSKTFTKRAEQLDSNPVLSIYPNNSAFEIMKTFDEWIVFIYSFVTMYLIASGESLLPLINFKILKWNLNILAGLIFGYGLVLVVASSMVSKICTSQKSVYRIGFISLPAIMISFTGLLVIAKATEPRDHFQDGISLFLFLFCLVFVWIFESIVLRSILGRMVHSNLQSFAEASRNGVSRFGMILSSFVTPFLLPYLTIYSTVCITTGALMILIYILRRKTLSK